jgi:heterotetrameric sarcosine oxidase gamma subunit
VSDRKSGDIGTVTPGHYGAETAGVTLSEAVIAVAWNVQGNPAHPGFVACAQQIFDVALPTDPNTTRRGDKVVALWLGPRSWLLVEGSPPGRPSPLTDFHAKRDALNAYGGALFDVSASRVAYRIGGTHAVTVLAKSCPLDFDPGVFPVNGCAQSVFGHVNALFFREDAASTFSVLVARSFAHDTWRLLCRSSAQYGYDVIAPRAIAASG